MVSEKEDENKKTVLFDELALVRTAQKDRKVMEQLLQRLHPRVNQVVWALVGNREQAEEIAQAAMLELLKSAGKYRGEGSLEAWAGEVTYRTGLKLLKRSWRWHRHHIPTDEPLDMWVDQPLVDKNGPERTLSKRRLYELLAEKMKRIPEKNRTAFVLHSIQGYTVSEVSQIMCASSNTTKYRLKSAIREMRIIFVNNPELWEAMREAKNE